MGGLIGWLGEVVGVKVEGGGRRGSNGFGSIRPRYLWLHY